MYFSYLLYLLAFISLGLFILTLIVASIVKIVHYLNGKPILTPKKLTRKLLGIEMGAAVLFLGLGFISYIIRLYI